MAKSKENTRTLMDSNELKWHWQQEWWLGILETVVLYSTRARREERKLGLDIMLYINARMTIACVNYHDAIVEGSEEC